MKDFRRTIDAAAIAQHACAWPHAPAHFTIPELNCVHVWCVDLRSPAEMWQRAADRLPDDERQRAGRLVFDHLRRQFVVRRSALRRLLGRYLDVDPLAIRFAYGPNGKPRLDGPLAERGLQFNLSSSQNLAVIAVARERDLGVDVEWMREMSDADAIARRYFSATENDVLQRLGPADRLDAFFQCWTQKEACGKATGEGLARPLNSFDVAIDPDQTVRVVDLDRRRAPDGWSLRRLDVIPGFAGAIAAAGHGLETIGWTLTPAAD